MAIALKVEPGKPFVYYYGSAWDEGVGGPCTRGEWDRYTLTAPVDFRVPTDRRYGGRLDEAPRSCGERSAPAIDPFAGAQANFRCRSGPRIAI